MIKSRFSPAPVPWRFDWYRGRPAIVDANGLAVAFVDSTRGKLEAEEVNAEHAARCVNAHDDLLEALQMILPELRGLAMISPSTIRPYLDAAESAVAKATGGQS